MAAAPAVHAAPSNFTGFNTLVNGYQDEFDGGTLAGKGWTVFGQNVYTQDAANSVLHVAGGAAADPNKLLYNGAAYSNSIQDVLMRVKVTAFGTTDGDRGGPAVASNTTNGQGIDFQFRDLGAGRSTVLLNDALRRDAAVPFAFQNDVYYWMRLTHSPAADASGNEASVKIWLADGTTAEPAAPQAFFDYAGAPADLRTGLAGISATSLGTAAAMDVDYILIRSPGLPQITAGAVPEPGSVALLGLGAVGVLARRGRRAC